MHGMNLFQQILILLSGVAISLQAVPPVLNYAGQVTVNGEAFDGNGLFKFALVNADGKTTYWSNDGTSVDGSEPQAAVSVTVNGGLYAVLLGNTAQQGMGPIDPTVFVQHSDAKLRVWFSDGVNGFQQLSPDRPFASVPYAFSAGTAQSATIADGSINKSMLGQDVIADLNRTVTPQMIQSSSITTAQLNEQILKYLKPEITHTPQAPGLVFDGQTVTLLSQAEGKYLSYQWYKNGQPIAGATGDRYVIEDVNGTLHDGNYSLVVSNDFGTVTTQSTQLVVDGTPTSHTVASISMDMIFCPPGTFMMGQEGVATPVHHVTLTNGFYLGKYEVTQAQYETVMTGNSEGLNAKPSNWPNNNDRPVEKVSWNDVQVFLSRLNDMEQTAGRLPTGWKYVLPTEAQWEYACRAGTTTAYSWGNDINSSRANYNWDGAHNTGNDFKQTRDVGKYAANPWGFFDMHGNVWERVSDWKANYPGGAQTNPEGPASGSFRVERGGSWFHVGSNLRSAKRRNDTPGGRYSDVGFRVGFQAAQPDTANPELELFGGAAITREAGQAWAEPGVAGHDARDGNITDQIVVTGTVDMNSTGTYLLTYSVQDAAGNPATATRTVTVTGNRTVDLNATVAMDMIWCPPGTFTMGSPLDEAHRGNDENQTQVMLTKGFYLGKYEVTQAQYEAVMTGNTDGLSATPSQWPNNPNRPVERVSWGDAQVFLTRLNAEQAGNLPTGWSYVLPTESQWEYACRAGTTTAYSWGDTITSTDANYNRNVDQTSDVGNYAANPWGFFDMHGNVWEWTADWYNATYSTGNPVIDPTGPNAGSLRVKRSGSWHTPLEPGTGNGGGLRSASRTVWAPPTLRDRSIGFRVSLQKSQ
jgi:formylglycine-generating enzyme required for sulfatase activity